MSLGGQRPVLQTFDGFAYRDGRRPADQGSSASLCGLPLVLELRSGSTAIV